MGDKAAVITTYSASMTAVAASGLTVSHWIGIASLVVAVCTAVFNVWWKLETLKRQSCSCDQSENAKGTPERP